MSVPGIVQSTLDGEEIAARVSLGSEDELYVTSSSTLVYRSDGLLRDESVDEFPHDAERLTLSEGRRKTKFSLEYPLEGTREFSIPASKTDDVLHPVLAGVLNGNDITEPGETVIKPYRFSELTLIVTSERLVKHIGSAVWDEDFEEYHFGDVTNLSFEDGSVATQIVLEVSGRPQRIKAPNEEANDLRERLERALFDYHDVGSLAELNEKIGEDEDERDDTSVGSTMDFGGGVDPLDANPPEPDEYDGDAATDTDTSAPAATNDAAAADESEDASARTTERESAIPESIDARRDRPDDRAEDAESTGTADTGARFEAQVDSTGPEAGDAGSEPETETEPERSSSTSTAASAATAQRTDASSIDDGAASRADSQSIRSDVGTASASGAGIDSDVRDRLDALEDAVDRQNDLIEQQQRTIEQLIEELRQGR